VNATFSATMKMVDALTKAGKPYDLVVMLEQNHTPTPYALNRMRMFFEEHLKP
jgi:dipeptidyl aminopeptidase/acylaminoacyl peptidase